MEYAQEFPVWSVTLAATDVLFVPGSFVVAERYLNKQDVYGLRESVVVNPQVMSDMAKSIGFAVNSFAAVAKNALSSQETELIEESRKDLKVWLMALDMMQQYLRTHIDESKDKPNENLEVHTKKLQELAGLHALATSAMNVTADDKPQETAAVCVVEGSVVGTEEQQA